MRRPDSWKLLRWLLLIAWLGLVWHFGETLVLTGPTPHPTLRWLFRKSTHLVVYGVLGGLLVPASGRPVRWTWIMGWCLVIALGDEIHQEFVPGRTFALHDVALDLLGGMLGVLAGLAGRVMLATKKFEGEASTEAAAVTSPREYRLSDPASGAP